MKKLKPKASKAIRSKPQKLTATRFVVMIGEEGAVMVRIERGKVAERFFTPEYSAQETQPMLQALKENPSVPVAFVFDTSDQSYAQQSLPPVSPLGLNKLIKRRMAREMGKEEIRNHLILGRTGENKKEWDLLMIALHRSPVVASWLDAVCEWPNPLLGIYLLPVEIPSLSTLIAAELQKTDAVAAPADAAGEQDTSWQLLVTYNKISGVRQVVSRNGKLIFSRLGQPAVDMNPETVAGTIEQETASTVEYVKRLGLADNEPINMYLILARDVSRILDARRFAPHKVTMFSPHQAAEMLHIEGATQETDRFGDAFICAAIGGRKRFTLPFPFPQYRHILQLEKAVKVVKVASVVIALGLFGQSLVTAWQAFSLSGEVDEIRKKTVIKQQELDAWKTRQTANPEQLARMIGIASIYQSLVKHATSPSELLVAISELFPNGFPAKSITWEVTEKPTVVDAKALGGLQMPPAPEAAKAQSGPTAEMMMEFTLSSSDPKLREQVRAETNDVLNTLRAGLTNYKVQYVSLPGFLGDDERIDASLADGGKQTGSTIAKAKIALFGPAIFVKEAKDVATGNVPPEAPAAPGR